MRFWLLLLIVFIALASFLYYSTRLSQENFSNGNYFSILAEVSQKFNENLTQIITLHQYGESETAIRSIFSSYLKKKSSVKCEKQNTQYQISLSGSKLSVMSRCGLSEKNSVKATPQQEEKASLAKLQILGEINVDDILPQTKTAFSGYLIIGKNNQVVAGTPNKSGLSFTNFNQVSQLIAERQNQNWQSLSGNAKVSNNSGTQSLPGQSELIDVELTSTEYRLFIYPFKLKHALYHNSESLGDYIHVVGILPKSVLKQYENQRWNLSLLAIILVLLVFGWMMARLFMLSNNQPVGELFYKSIMVSSYILFVMVIALMLAFFESYAEQKDKEVKAFALMEQIENEFASELRSILFELDKYRAPFQKTANHIESLLQQKKSPIDTDDSIENLKLDQTKDLCIPVELDDLSEIISTSLIDQQESKILARIKQETKEGTIWGGMLFDRELKPNEIKEDNWSVCANAINVFNGGGAENNDLELESFPNELTNNAKNKLLSIFMLETTDGISKYPSFYHYESNKLPTSYDLSHRDYFKIVRDKKGWDVTLPEIKPKDNPAELEEKSLEVKNLYIQRLRNINNGTRGTTLSMPLSSEVSQYGRYLLLADIALTSLTATPFVKNDTLLDLTYMVIDRDSGDVLFHLDDDRSLVENIYQSGDGTSDIAHRIRSGIGLTGNRWVDGFYHGVAGTFSYSDLPVKQWALVVFMPDESINTFMTNLFLVNLILISSAILITALFFVSTRPFFNTGLVKTALKIPLVIDRRKLMVFTSVYISSLFIGYWLGVSFYLNNTVSSSPEFWFSSLACVICLFWGYREYVKYYKSSLQVKKSPINYQVGAGILVVVYLLIGVFVFSYLSSIAYTAHNGLEWYYEKKVYPARLVQEKNELSKVALTRYPNSVRQLGKEPLNYMPIATEWREKLLPANADSPFLQPKDVEHYSKLIYTSEMQDWIGRFLFTPNKGPSRLRNSLGSSSSDRDVKYQLNLWYSLSLVFGYILLVFLWIRFNRQILAIRLYGPPKFLRHLNQNVLRSQLNKPFKPTDGLLIDTTHRPDNGVNFSLTLEKWHLQPSSVASHFQELFDISCFAKEMAQSEIKLPNLVFSVNKNKQGKFLVALWGFETSLERKDRKALLLRLLNHFKSLLLEGEIAGLILHDDFSLVKRQFLKDAQTHDDEAAHSALVNVEYHEWAECFKDFDVVVPSELTHNLDLEFLRQEINSCNWLKFLSSELALDESKPGIRYNFRRWLNLSDSDKSHAEWNSLTYLFARVEALYRFKWESCSDKEKLALYYLVSNKRINPANLSMLEQLALRGLIIVKLGRVHIINRSFAQFVKHAENSETIQRLIEAGDAGKWKDYRLPITLLILFVIIGIALTSGNSLYMIVASVMGVLGTIGSLTNSASIIRNNLRN
ncbi:hypothetical protein ACUR5C_04445 [Aliikangiella sp. IMCC44653]